jgi:hypothetical protein
MNKILQINSDKQVALELSCSFGQEDMDAKAYAMLLAGNSLTEPYLQRLLYGIQKKHVKHAENMKIPLKVEPPFILYLIS